MDTKLKNIPYNIITKFFAIILFIGALLMIIDFQYVSRNSGEALYKEQFYETESFQESYVRLSHNVVEKYLDLVDEETIEAKRTGTDAIISKNRLQSINDNLRRATSFLYVLFNTKTGDVLTNIADDSWKLNTNEMTVEDYITSFETVVLWDSSGVYFPAKSVMENQPFIYRHYNPSSQFSSTNVNATDVIYRLRSGDWRYYTAVDFNSMKEDMFFGTEYYSFTKYKNLIETTVPKVITSMIVLFFMTIYLAIVIGKKNQESDPCLFFYDYVPLEIQSLIALFAFFPLAQYYDLLYEPFDETKTRIQVLLRSAFFLIALISEGLSIIRLVKTKYIYKNPIVFKLAWFIKKLFTLDFVSPIAKIKVIFIVSCYVLFSVILLGATYLRPPFPLPIFILLVYLMGHVFLVAYVLIQAKDISSLIVATQKRAEGQMDYPIIETDYKLGLLGFARDLNALQSGLEVALEEAIKGEKLKTELITNVSHDLKNPLTSIVTYIDLLEKSLKQYEDESISLDEKEEIKKNMDDYIHILNNKSYRLKTLIEDLVAASKASSGNLDVDLMHINVRQLILQCLGEKEHLLSQSDIELVLSPISSAPVWAYVDPNHMYRVFDNLLSNIIKYSMRHTRVFIHFESDIEQIIITFKNISNHPLDNNSRNLKRRFVRGDASRSTEGSGLGLSIVESLLVLQKGKMDIVVDGDLFKVIVYIPKGEDIRQESLKVNHYEETDEKQEEETTESKTRNIDGEEDVVV